MNAAGTAAGAEAGAPALAPSQGPTLLTPDQAPRPAAPPATPADAGAAAPAGAAASTAAAAAPSSVAANLHAALAAAAAVEQPLFQMQQLPGAAAMPAMPAMPALAFPFAPGYQPWLGPSMAFALSQAAAPATQLAPEQLAALFSQQQPQPQRQPLTQQQQQQFMQFAVAGVKQEPVEGGVTAPAGLKLPAVKQEPGAAAVKQEPGAAAVKQEPGIAAAGPAVRAGRGTARGGAVGRGRGRGRGRAAAAAGKPKARRRVVESSDYDSEEAASVSSSSSSSSSSSEDESEEEQYVPPPRGRRPAAAAAARKPAAAAPRKRGRPPGNAAAAAAAAAAEDSGGEEAVAAPKKKPRKGAGHIDRPTPVEGGWMLDPHTPLIYRDVGGSGSKVAAFTLDGTICVTKLGLPYAGSATDWMYPFPGIPDRLAQLQREGHLLCILNNQGNVKAALNGKASANARGKVDAILASLQSHGVDPNQVKVLLAPSMDALRKPDPGMWHFLANRLNSGVPIDLSKSFYVGDSEGDQGFAARVGLRCFRPASFFQGGAGGAMQAGGNDGLVEVFSQMEQAYLNRGEPESKLVALRQAKQVIASTAHKITCADDLKGVRGIGPVTSSWINEYCRTGRVKYLDTLQADWW